LGTTHHSRHCWRHRSTLDQRPLWIALRTQSRTSSEVREVPKAD